MGTGEYPDPVFKIWYFPCGILTSLLPVVITIEIVRLLLYWQISQLQRVDGVDFYRTISLCQKKDISIMSMEFVGPEI